MNRIRVGINARALSKPNQTGVARYTERLLSAFGEYEQRVECVLFAIGSVPDSLAPYENIRSANERPPTHSGSRAYLWEQLRLPFVLRSYDLDLFHTPSGLPPVLAQLPLVTTIHDISPIVHPEWFSKQYAALYRVLTPLAVRASDHVLTVSKFSLEEIVSEYPSAAGKTTVVYNGVETPDVGETEPDLGLKPGGYLLFVGAMNPRKNLRRLLEGYRQYRRRTDDPLPLALAGPSRELFARSTVPDVKGIRTLGFVADETLAWLYRNAAAFVYPSLYEGFGLPIVEAMKSATPVVTSNVGAMKEVADDAAYIVNPFDPDEIATAIGRVTEDESLASELIETARRRAEKFTWDAAARQTIQVYDRVADE